MSCYEWDNQVAKKFIGKLVKIADVCTWLDVSYSCSYRNFKKDISSGKWHEDWASLDEFEINKIDEMLEKRDFNYWGRGSSTERIIMIRKYAYDLESKTANYLIFARNEDKVTCITEDFPEDAYERLTQVWPWHLLLNDFHLIGELTSIELFGNKYIYLDNSTHWQLKFVRDRLTRHTGRSFFVSDLAWDLGYDGYLQVKSKNLIEKYKEELRKLADSENKVLFPTTKDPLYSSMTNWAYRHGGSINQLIRALGFTRVYKRENPFQDILLPFDRPEPGDDDLTDKSLEERLKRLRRLQGVLDKTKAGQYRLSRCRELVDELKKLYKNQCQLCGRRMGKYHLLRRIMATSTQKCTILSH